MERFYPRLHDAGITIFLLIAIAQWKASKGIYTALTADKRLTLKGRGSWVT